MIPSAAALEIGLNVTTGSNEREITTGSDRIICPTLTIPQITAIGKTVKNVEVFCHTLPEPSPVDGLLGLNFLMKFDLRLNFKQGFLETR